MNQLNEAESNSPTRQRRESIAAAQGRVARITADSRWAALLARDASADGAFVYAVTTTGVYCRPTCAARRPRPEHVQFHRTGAMAERAGFRPCKRCRPGEPRPMARHAEIVARACRQIEEAEREPCLHALAAQAGMSPFHFHRIFRAMAGMTPKRYAVAHRHRNVQQTLRSRDTVTEAMYEAGYNANSRFYADAPRVLGMTPSAFRSGGAGATIRFAIGACTLGAVLVAQSERGLCAILLGDNPETLLHELQDAFPQAVLVGGDADFEATVSQVVGFVETPHVGLDLPLDIRGTAFQQRVWAALRALPAGATASYAAVAETMSTPKAVRAVAGACAANVLAVAIPCHRVVRTDGSLSGYRWGVERKRALLDREARYVCARADR